MDMIALKYRC